jgi:hypothetical protein
MSCAYGGAGLIARSRKPRRTRHSRTPFSAEFDANKPLDDGHGHCRMDEPAHRFYVDVKDDAGNVTNWGLSSGDP